MKKYTALLEPALLFCIIFLCSPGSSAAFAVENQQQVLREAEKQLLQSEYEAARALLEKAVLESRKSAMRENEARALYLQAVLNLERGDYQRAGADIQRALTLYEQLKSLENLQASRLVLVKVLYRQGYREKAWRTLEEVQKSITSETSRENLIALFLLRGEMLMDRDAFELARKNFTECLNLSRSAGNVRSSVLAQCNLALLYGEMGKIEEARQKCLDATIELRQLESPWLTALLLQASGKISSIEGQYQDSLSALTGALALHRKTGNYYGAVDVLITMGEIYEEMGAIEEGQECAEDAYQMALEHHILKKALKASLDGLGLSSSVVNAPGRDRWLARYRKTAGLMELPLEKAGAFFDEARIISIFGDSERQAPVVLSRALELYTREGEGEGEVECLCEMGKLAGASSQYEEAIRIFDRALERYGSLPYPAGGEGAIGGEILRQKARLYMRQHLYDRARDMLVQARDADRASSQKYETVLDWRGLLQVSLVSYNVTEIKEDISSAMAEIEAIEDAPRRAQAFNIIITTILSQALEEEFLVQNQLFSFKDSVAFRITGDIFDNPKLIESVVRGYREWIACEKKKQRPREEGIAHLFMGLFYFSGNRTVEALDSFLTAREIFREHRLTLWEAQANVYISFLAMEEGKYREAISLAEKSAAIYSEAGMSDKETILSIYRGVLSREMGSPAESNACYQKALQLAEKKESPLLRAVSLVGLGQTYYLMGKYEESLSCYTRAVPYLEKTGRRKMQASSLQSMGDTLLAMGRDKEGLAYYEKALALYREAGNIFFETDVALALGAQMEKNGREREALAMYGDILDRLCRLGEKVPEAQRKRAGQRGAVSGISALFERVIALLVKEGRSDEALRYYGISQAYGIFSSFDPDKVNPGDEQLRALMDKMDDLQDKMGIIRDRIGDNREERQNQYLSGVLATTRQEFFSVINEIKKRNPDYGQFVIIQGPELDELQQALPEDTLLLQYYPATNGLFIFSISRGSFSIRRVDVMRDHLYGLVRDLREGIIGKKESVEYRKARHLLFQYLIEQVTDEVDKKAHIEIIPSGMLWYLPFETLGRAGEPDLLVRKPVGYLSSTDLLRILTGEKKGKKKQKLLAFGNPAGAGLPYAQQEVEKIGALFPGSIVLTGSDATKERFIREAPDTTFVHIASHSVLDSRDVNRSHIEFADGNLELGEIYGIRMPDTSMVVLSSCQSALGEENPGRELASIAAAFSISGSPSVVASLWPVEDNASSELLLEFYRNLKKGLPRTEALQQAKCSLLKNPETSQPFYWAPFILLGDWR